MAASQRTHRVSNYFRSELLVMGHQSIMRCGPKLYSDAFPLHSSKLAPNRLAKHVYPEVHRCQNVASEHIVCHMILVTDNQCFRISYHLINPDQLAPPLAGEVSGDVRCAIRIRSVYSSRVSTRGPEWATVMSSSSLSRSEQALFRSVSCVQLMFQPVRCRL